MDDPIGHAIQDFYEIGKAPDILLNTNYTEDETVPPSYFFRSYKGMPSLEKTAIKLCKGKILDVGAGAGSHSLHLQKTGFDVTALEKSKLAAGIIKKRGVKNVVISDLYRFNGETFDTILVLMNGTGLGSTLTGLNKMLVHLKSVLKQGGQLLIDSSDIKYLFEEDDGSFWVNLSNNGYYGEMDYKLKYKNYRTQFNWLFIDFEKLNEIAENAGFRCQLVKNGKHHDYLAKLTF